MTRRIQLVIAVSGMLLASCTPNGPSSDSLADALVSPRSDTPAKSTTISGVLSMDTIEGGCPHLASDDGTRYEVIYPEGWRVSRTSAELTDPQGRVAARAGTRLTLRGAIASDMASTCQIGPIFRATDVSVE